MSEETKKVTPLVDESSPEESYDNQPVLNKVVWHKKVEDMVGESAVSRSRVSVLLMDLDSFKSVNDTLGHQEGDRVIESMREILGLITNKLRGNTTDERDDNRHSDIVTAPKNVINNTSAGRFGGDEFGIVCEAGKEGAKIIAERIRQAVHEFLELPNNEPLKKLGIDISIGTATLRPDESASDLLKRADLELYDDKMSHLPDFPPDQVRLLKHVGKTLEIMGIRDRDLPKILGKIALQSIEQQSYNADRE